MGIYFYAVLKGLYSSYFFTLLSATVDGCCVYNCYL